MSVSTTGVSSGRSHSRNKWTGRHDLFDDLGSLDDLLLRDLDNLRLDRALYVLRRRLYKFVFDVVLFVRSWVHWRNACGDIVWKSRLWLI